MIRVDAEQGIHRILLGDAENRLDRDALDGWNRALDAIEADADARLLVSIGQGRHYCNGYDMDFFATRDRAARREFIRDYERLLARLLGFPIPTAALLNGHASGAGALLALAHDERVMREDRGYFCLPEIDAGIEFRPGMLALLELRLGARALRECVLGGAPLDAQRCLELGIVEAIAEPDRLVARAAALLEPRCGKPRASVAASKRGLARHALGELTGRRPVPR